MSTFRKSEDVQNVEFEEIESIEKEVNAEGDDKKEKSDKEKKGFMSVVKTGAKKSGKVVAGFVAGLVTAVGIGILLNQGGRPESADDDEIYYLESEDDETYEEDDSEE